MGFWKFEPNLIESNTPFVFLWKHNAEENYSSVWIRELESKYSTNF